LSKDITRDGSTCKSDPICDTKFPGDKSSHTYANNQTPTCWVMSDGRAGIENPCLGLAEALGLSPIVKRVRLRSPWRQTTPYLPLPGIHLPLDPSSDRLDPPWPDLLISSGRQAVALSMAVGRRSPRTVRVHIQNPGVPFNRFDLVSLPRHDGKSGANLVQSIGAIHRVTAAKLSAAAQEWAHLAVGKGRPLVSVLIGGSNRFCQLTPAMMAGVAEQLAALVRDQGVGMLITTSRRTGVENEAILRQALTGLPVFLWDGTGPNPYFGMLALADALIVTSDSVAMVSEAASTGKPVHVIDLPGNAPKFARFHDALRTDGITRSFQGRLEQWTYQPLDDTARLAARVRDVMASR